MNVLLPNRALCSVFWVCCRYRRRRTNWTLESSFPVPSPTILLPQTGNSKSWWVLGLHTWICVSVAKQSKATWQYEFNRGMHLKINKIVLIPPLYPLKQIYKHMICLWDLNGAENQIHKIEGIEDYCTIYCDARLGNQGWESRIIITCRPTWIWRGSWHLVLIDCLTRCYLGN